VTPTLVDHGLAALIMVLMPLVSAWSWPRVLAKLQEDAPGVRSRLYLRGMASQWLITALIAGAWLGRGRELDALGWRAPSGVGAWVAAALALAFASFMLAQLRSIAAARGQHAEIAAHLDAEVPFLPRSPREDALFAALCGTAGLCEELMFRGFCVWWASTWLGAWGAVVGTSLIFGLSHAYQGRRGMVKTGVAGLVAGALFLISGSLWVPMALHAFVDLHAGALYRTVRLRGQ
jgi:membrane protease YdiL (CAAX protease family)